MPALESTGDEVADDQAQRTFDFGRGEGFGTNAPDFHTKAGTTLRASLYARTFSGFAARQRRVASAWQLEHQDDNPSFIRRLRRNSLFFFRCPQCSQTFVFLTLNPAKSC